jgi:hypothetical protein
MTDSDSGVPEALLRDLLEWIGPAGRPYAEVIDAWRTSCPKLAVWEEANVRSLVVRSRTADGVAWVSPSPRCHAGLNRNGTSMVA